VVAPLTRCKYCKVPKMLPPQRATGFVSLVGAGPGDPGLLTLRGRDRLAEADVVVHDRLVHPALLELAPATAERIYIGKGYGRNVLDQAELNQLLVFLAAQGKRVVRLKGGDPFVFGRGSEEAEVLARHGIPFEIVPGISSAIAAPAYAGIPVTDRRFSSSTTFVTGHRDPSDPANPVDWELLGGAVDTLVILMGTRYLGAIAVALSRGGKSAETPAAVIEWGTHDRQRTLVGTLATIAEDVKREGYASPFVAVIGDVVSLRPTLDWFTPEEVLAVRDAHH